MSKSFILHFIRCEINTHCTFVLRSLIVFPILDLLCQSADFFHQTWIHNICTMHILLHNVHIFRFNWRFWKLIINIDRKSGNGLFGYWKFFRKLEMGVFKILNLFFKLFVFFLKFFNFGSKFFFNFFGSINWFFFLLFFSRHLV